MKASRATEAPAVKASDTAFMKRWEQARAQGRWRYLLLSGVLAWGVPMFVLMTFVVDRPAQLTAGILLLSAAVWLSGGLLFGVLSWFLSEKRFNRLVSTKDSSA